MRFAGCRVACALTLTCALASGARAIRQSSSGDSNSAKEPASKSTPAHSPTTKKTASGSSASSGSKTHTASTGKRSSRRRSVRVRGQQKIDSERALQIQTALVREHYLTGEPTGKWNEASEDAMRRYQADHGWQTKEVPDSRALIKLGLGPSNDHLLNPESAMTTSPVAPKAAAMPTNSHTATPASDPPPASNPMPASNPVPGNPSSPQ